MTKALDQAEALATQAENKILAFLAAIEKIKENAPSLQVFLDEAVRRRKAGEDFDTADVAEPSTVQAPKTHTAAFLPAQLPTALSPLGL